MNFDDLEFLTVDGYLYNQTVSLKHAINLFISYADALELTDLVQEKPDLNVSHYAVRNELNYAGPKNIILS